MRYYLGIDPGLHGAMALIDDKGKFYELIDLPIKRKYLAPDNIKQCIDAPKLEHVLSYLIAEYGCVEVYLEDVHGRGGWNAAISFGLGETVGALRSVIDMVELDLTLITPTFWKKYLKLSSDKEQVRAYAIKCFPDAAQYLKYKKNHDRAEALLIAKYAMEVNKGFI